ncbi:hypothetical protein [Pontibacter pamirensis]|uniref:hypothetical protein n=1 Tax=Pontibacter pamirensis TaxID=2562824 RepID=UPI001389A091|nr:hypothetical protein [Pontibacter pamirensis]
MNRFFQFAFLLVFLSCNSTQSQEAKEINLVTAEQAHPVGVAKADYSKAVDSSMSDTGSSYLEETATYYIVIADTSGSYKELREEMLSMHGSFKIPIDTMGRSYNESKNLIALPEDDEDEVFAGDYCPRRFPSTALSLEYLGLYQEKAAEKTMALVAGIYENKSSADSAVSVFRQIEQKAFVVRTDMYIGCIH